MTGFKAFYEARRNRLLVRLRQLVAADWLEQGAKPVASVRTPNHPALDD